MSSFLNESYMSDYDPTVDDVDILPLVSPQLRDGAMVNDDSSDEESEDHVASELRKVYKSGENPTWCEYLMRHGFDEEARQRHVSLFGVELNSKMFSDFDDISACSEAEYAERHGFTESARQRRLCAQRRYEDEIDFIANETRPVDIRNPVKGLQMDRIGLVLTNLAIQIYGFVKCKDRSFCQIVASVNGIFMALGLDTSLYEWVAGELWFLTTGIEVKPESLEELGEALGKDAVKFITTNLRNIVEKIIKFCSAALIAPSLMQSKMHYFKSIGHALDKTRLTSFTSAIMTVDGIASMLAHCVSRGVEYLVNWSFPDDVNTVLRESSLLREAVENTLSSMDRNTRDDMRDSLSAMQLRLATKHKRVQSDKFTVAQALLKEHEAVTKAITRLNSYAIHSMRVPAPLSVMLVGEPAIGKSEITKILMYIIASVKRPGADCVPYKPSEICTAPMSKYWNGLDNNTRIVIFDDVNALLKNGDNTEKVAVNWAEQLIQLVNNQGFTPELAEAHMKGTVQPQLHAVISTANGENRYGNAAGMANVDAVFRRYDMIDVELKDDFVGDNGQIDFNKVAAAGADLYTVNPWKLSYKKYDLKTARERTRNSVTKRGIEPGLWKHIDFMYDGKLCCSDDMTFDMLRELFKQQCALHTDNGAAIAKMDENVRNKLFPLLVDPIVDDSTPIVQPQVIDVNTTVYGRAMPDVGAFGYRHGRYQESFMENALRQGFWFQLLGLCAFPFTSVFWLIYKGLSWRPPSWCPDDRRMKPFRAYCRDSLRSCVLTVETQLLCMGMELSRRMGPALIWVLKMAGVNLDELVSAVLFGGQVKGVFGALSPMQLTKVCETLRERYVMLLTCLADKERQAKMKRVLIKGVFAGIALGTLIKCAQFYLKCRTIGKLADEFDKRVGSNPVCDPESTVDKDGKVTVDLDPKLDVVPRQVVFKGSYATMTKDRLRRAAPTQTVEDSRHLAGRCVFRATIRPCTGGQLPSVQYSEFKSDLYVFGYDTYNSGTYMVTVAHAFARDFPQFAIVLHDSSRKPREHIIYKKDIAFAPKMCLNGCEHDIDMCMFELPRSVTGSLPLVRKLVTDSKLSKGDAVTRLVPSYEETRGIYAVDVMGSEFLCVKSHVYSAGTPASQLLPNPVSYWISGTGDDGLCGSLIMSGGTIVAMHTGSHASSEAVTACPVGESVLNIMKARLKGRSEGEIANARLDDYIVRAPYLEEYTKSNMEIKPDVSVRVPGALEPTLSDSYYELVGTLVKDGTPVNVRAKTNIQLSKHVEFLIDYLPDVAGIVRNYAIPSLSYKMRDTITAFIAKSSIPRPVDTHLLALAKEKVGSALYRACHDIVLNNQGFARMRVLNIQGGLDGKGFNMGGKVPINTSAGVAFPGVKSDYVNNVYSPEHDEHFICFFEENEMSMEIRDSVYDIIERRKAGEVGLILNFICPKDEVLPVKSDGRTKPMRHINKMDFAHIVVMRMYFQPILILLGYDPLSCGHSVGLDPTVYYTELVKSLINGDPGRPLYASEVEASAFVATDYSGFDLSLSGDVISAVMDIFINLSYLLDYTDEDRRVMTSMAYDICNPSVVMLGTVVKMAGVNTSGNPLTTMINCVANMLINCQIHAMIKYDVLHGKYMVDYPRDYSSMIVADLDFSLRSIVTYGDDVVVRVDKDSMITQPATIYYGKQLGYVITGSDKGDTVTTFAEDFGFLKRKFHLYVRRDTSEVVMCLAPLAMDSIFKPFVWGDFKKLDINDHYAGLIKSALHELVQHGEDVYNRHVPNLWAFVEAFSVETKPRKNAPVVFRSRIRSRFKSTFPSWREAILDKYGHSLIQTNSELSLSELDLIKL
jgi:hypothetical protein